MPGTPTTYTGKDAIIYIANKDHETYAIADFSITMDRGTVEESLVCEEGNFYTQGSLGIDGSLTAAKLDDNSAGVLLSAMINGTPVAISGSVGPKSLHFYFKSCQITGFDISIGDANTITEASIDFTVLHAYKVSSVQVLPGGGTLITDAKGW